MVKDTIGILSCDQSKINRQFYEMILKLQKNQAGENTDISDLEDDVSGIKDDVSDIQDAIGDESKATTILGRIKALEDAS